MTQDYIGIIGDHSKENLVDSKFVKNRLIEFQNQTWAVLREIQTLLREGMTEEDARKTALETFQEHGVTKHWHRPYIRFGVGTTLTFHDPVQPELRLKKNDPVYIDLGPVWDDSETELSYEGDVGDTFVFGVNSEAEQCAEAARRIFQDVRAEWKAGNISGQEIYGLVEKKASSMGYRWVEKVEGHRIGDFPHHKYSKERLARLPFSPVSALWVLEVQINDPKLQFGAFYEDILL